MVRTKPLDIPVIRVEFSPLYENDPNPYKATIIHPKFTHGGVGPNPALALLRAAAHWEARQG